VKIEFSRHIFEKCSISKYHENPSSGNKVVPSDGQTDTTKLTTAFPNFANAPENYAFCPYTVFACTCPYGFHSKYRLFF